MNDFQRSYFNLISVINSEKNEVGDYKDCELEKLIEDSESDNSESKAEAKSILNEYTDSIKHLEQWRFICIDFQNYALKQSKILKYRIRKGIPEMLRGYSWKQLVKINNELIEVPDELYDKLCNQKDAPFEDEIARDIPRTFPKHILFRDKGSLGQQYLFRVLRAYSLHDTDVGYCQGMGFLSGILLLYMSEQDTFEILINIMHGYSMAGLFKPGLPLLAKFLYQYEKLFKSHMPRLFEHLRKENVESTMYASQWFMTLFSYSFPINVVVRIIDIFLYEGIKIIFRVALAVPKLLQDKLLSQNFEGALHILKTSSNTIDPDNLIHTALNIKLKRSTLQEIEREYEWKNLKPN